ncbi:MFS general substrate transporter [Pseudovirgaria hyperparasitica]|uniref:MFS general substrate transporter n=1 Tax=Pseudovirgaria hyperparasitica TaxID=470096 RepID=A0A6A6W5K8_9PEZI|nr:MFS general substrate transporter [Pseudovirgaria hyperparasitica]KAF2757236.1 MFS general substrate transporter [Pseudovirgaria hyperparasitica]
MSEVETRELPRAGEEDVTTSEDTAASPPTELTGWRLGLVMTGLWLALFLSALDGTIVSTALIEISNDLKSLSQANWLVIAYFLTYNAFLLLVAKLSDTFGTKNLLILSNIIFFVFSAACAASKTMTQLIVFRALQGMGGSGLYTLVFVVILKLISPSKIGFYSGIISSVFAIANLLGPILGGSITSHTTWRWIFWINLPITAISTVLLALAMPTIPSETPTLAKLRAVDWLGGLLSIAWPIPVLFALQQAEVAYPWSSPVIISTLTTGLVLLVLFACHETSLYRRTRHNISNISNTKTPILPIPVLTTLLPALLTLSTFLTGSSFLSATILLPARFQAVNAASPAHAGIQLLALVLATPPFALLAGLATPHPRITACLLLLAPCAILLGTALLSTLPASTTSNHSPDPRQYVYMALLGAGFGTLAPLSYALMKAMLHGDAHLAAATGLMNTARTLGGTLAIAVCSALLHGRLRRDLPGILPAAEQVGLVEESLANLRLLPDEEAVGRVRRVFGEAYNLQFRVLIAFAGANVVLSCVLVAAMEWKKRTGEYVDLGERMRMAEKERVRASQTVAVETVKQES